MLSRPRVIRRVVIVAAVLLVSGAAAAMKLTSWTPANMCFCPTPDHSNPAVKLESGVEALTASGNFRVPLDTGATAHSASGAFAAAPIAERAESSPGKSHEGEKHSWTPWGDRSNHRSSSASVSAPSVKLGSFWRMMSLVGHAHHEAQASTGAHVAVAASAHASAPKPSRPPANTSRPPSGGSGMVSPPGASESGVGSGQASPPPGSAFGEETTPVGQLAGGASASAGSSGSLHSGSSGLGGGSSAVGSAHAAAGVSNLAATPEPASFALIATGLLGIAGLIRRRRV